MSTAEKHKNASSSADKGKDVVIDPTNALGAEADELSGSGSVDKIREILFGIQMRD